MYSLYYVEVDSFYTDFWRIFNHRLLLKFFKTFSTSIEIIIWFLSFNLLIWCWYLLIDLHVSKDPYIPGINLTWSWCMILFMMLLDCFLEFWEFLHLCSSMTLDCNFLFLKLIVLFTVYFIWFCLLYSLTFKKKSKRLCVHFFSLKIWALFLAWIC